MGRRRAGLGRVATTAVITVTTTTCPGVPAGAPPPAGTPAAEVPLPGPHSGQPYSAGRSPRGPAGVRRADAAAGRRVQQRLAVSGLFGGRPLPASGYSLRFTAAGTYPYTCPIHPGMAGVVGGEVSARQRADSRV
jgi:hypothetical protein